MPSAGSSGSGRLHREPTSPEEIRALLRLAERDQRQARVPGLDPDGRFAFAYNAALQLATVYLRLEGIRVPTPARHAQTFQELFARLPPALRHWAADFDRARRKRHTLMYDQVGTVGEAEVAELLAQVAEFGEWVEERVRERFPDWDTFG